jgi:hypothetical protein
LFHHGQRGIPQILYSTEQGVRAAESVPAEGIARMKPLITGYGTGSVIGAGYRSEPSVTVRT